MKIRAVTINIAGIQFGWFEGRRDALINELRLLAPDIVFLQETTVVPDEPYDQTLDIGASIGLACEAFAPYGNLKENESPKLGGVAILSRWPFKTVEFRKLPSSVLDEHPARCALMGIIDIDDKEILVATTHLSYMAQEQEVRLWQATEFMEFLKIYNTPITIIGADFNATNEEPALLMLGESYKDAFYELHPDDPGITWGMVNDYIKTNRQDRRIDYLFSSEDVRIKKAEIVLNYKGPVYPSDHFGVMGDFEI